MRRYALPLAALLLVLAACTPTAELSPTHSAETPPAVSPSPPAPSGALTVRTDWSKLEPRPAPLPEVGNRWYEGYIAELIPRDDYGELVPYAGLRLMDDWPAADGCMYGLMTKNGVVITDPVFSSVYRPEGVPLLVLRQGDRALGEEWDPARISVAATDGSWCTGFDYRLCRGTPEGLLLFRADRLTLMAPDGAILHQYAPGDLGLTQEQFAGLMNDVQWGEGIGGQWYGDCLSLAWADDTASAVLIYQISAARQTVISYEEWDAFCAAEYEDLYGDDWVVQSAPGETVVTRGEERYVIPFGVDDRRVEVRGDLVLFTGWGAAYTLDGREILPPEEQVHVEAYMEDGTAVLLALTRQEGDGPNRVSYYLPDGTPVPMLDSWGRLEGGAWYRQMSLRNGLIELLDRDTATYYDAKTLECVFRTCLGYDDI
jgi:hypothetical protein